MSKKGKAGGKVDPVTAAKQQRCLDLAVQGFGYTQIAEQEGYASESGARAAVNAVLHRAAIDGAEELRPVLAARFTEMYRHGFEVMLAGRDQKEGMDLDMFKTGAVVADRALARLMRLFGMDQATMTVHAGTPGDLESLKLEFLKSLDGRAVIDGEIVADGGEADG